MFEHVGKIYVYVTLTLFVAGLVQFLFTRLIRKQRFSYKDKHVIVTGASTGLGNAYARLVAQAGAKLSIISKNEQRLNAARDELQRVASHKVFARSADVSNAAELNEAVKDAIAANGAPDLVVACAGLSHPGFFDDVDVAVFRDEMSLNYFGCVNLAKAVLPAMKQQRSGRIVFVSSVLALMGLIGYSPYCPTKYAIRGFADTLRNELLRYSIDVSIYFPASIASPGYEQENKTKPEITKQIEGSSTVTPAEAAVALDAGLQRGEYQITGEPAMEAVRILANGIAPRNNIAWEILFAAPLTLFGAIMSHFIDSAVKPTNAANSKKTN